MGYMKNTKKANLRMMVGMYSRIARDLGLDRSHVRRVALGLRRSARVEAAIDAEVDRIANTRKERRSKSARLAA